VVSDVVLLPQNKSITLLLSYLQAIRTPYLSTAPPPRHHQQRQDQKRAGAIQSTLSPRDVPEHLTDPQREAIDAETSTVLRDINNKITNLASAVNLQHETATKVLEKKYGRSDGFLWRWAAGDGDAPDAGKSKQQVEEEGRLRSLKQFRDGVLWYLGKVLKDALTRQQEMVQKRLDREQQKQMSVLYDPRNKGVRASRDVVDPSGGGGGHGRSETMAASTTRDFRGHDEYQPWTGAESSSGIQQDLSPEQLQLFEEENRGIFEHFNDQLARVTQVEKSLLDISSLQQTLVGHLGVQSEMIGSLVTDAANTDENVRRGNRELKRASERNSTARLVFYATAGLCSFLVVWDLIF
jgi:hypothetical protein